MLLYTSLVEHAIADMARTVPSLRHIDPSRVLVVGAERVSSTHFGNLAQCHALGSRQSQDMAFWFDPRTRRVVKASPWVERRSTRILVGGIEMRYMVLLRLPRLLEHDPLETIIHELMHIGPNFDGHLRKMRHGKRFDAMVARAMAVWREAGDGNLLEAMKMTYPQLTERWGSLVGRGFARKLVAHRACLMENPPPITSHPGIRSRRLTVDLDRVRMVEPKLSPADLPDEVTERDLVYRVYTPQSARKIAAAAVRCARDLFPALDD